MNFDLNINNYSLDELIQMFDLPTNFDKNIIEIKETKLRDSINNNNEINNDIRNQTINFITKAKNLILNGNNKNNNSDIEFLKNVYHATAVEFKPSKLENNAEHMVQIRKTKDYVESDPGKYFTSELNPIKSSH